MTRFPTLALALLTLGCAHARPLFHRPPPREELVADSLYWHAVQELRPDNKDGTLADALQALDVYLAAPVKLHHRDEAESLRRLARDAQQLAKVQAALDQAKGAAGDTRRADADTKGRDDESVKEIQRLKDQLAKANEELERIKKRLASPKP